MKKLLLGAIILLLFATSISLVEISCQKIHAQVNRPLSPSPTGTILLEKYTISQIIPKTITTTDSITNVTTTTTIYDTLYSGLNLFVSNIDGSNVRQIPIPSAYSIVSNYARLTSNADSVVFEVYGTGYATGIYTCALDGTGLTEVVVPNGTGTLGRTILCDVK